jgi:hypothetical protein
VQYSWDGKVRPEMRTTIVDACRRHTEYLHSYIFSVTKV